MLRFEWIECRCKVGGPCNLSVTLSYLLLCFNISIMKRTALEMIDLHQHFDDVYQIAKAFVTNCQWSLKINLVIRQLGSNCIFTYCHYGLLWLRLSRHSEVPWLVQVHHSPHTNSTPLELLELKISSFSRKWFASYNMRKREVGVFDGILETRSMYNRTEQTRLMVK